MKTRHHVPSLSGPQGQVHTRRRAVGLGLFACAMILLTWLSSCSDTSSPEADKTPPTIDLELLVWRVGPHDGSLAIVFYLNPEGSRDDVSPAGNLQARYDYDDDGTWDTEFQTAASFICPHPGALPVGTWTVACEMKDAAGNTAFQRSSLELPDWFPAAPDLMIGPVELSIWGGHEPGDPLQVGEGFTLAVRYQDWLDEDDAFITQRYYIDDELVGQQGRSPHFCASHLYCTTLFSLEEGIAQPGVHEIRVEATLEGGLVDTNPENNSAVLTVTVVEPR